MIPWMPICHQLASCLEVETQTNCELDTFDHLQIALLTCSPTCLTSPNVDFELSAFLRASESHF